MISLNVIVKEQFPEMRLYLGKEVSDELGGLRLFRLADNNKDRKILKREERLKGGKE